MFATTEAENAAADALREQGFPDDAVTAIAPGGARGKEQNDPGADAIAARIMAAFIPRAQARLYADGVSRGGTLVIVKAAWGSAVKAQRVMDAFDPIESGVADAHDPARVWDEKRPFSSAFGLTLLCGAATPASDMLSLPVLSKTQTPLSDALHLGLLASGVTSLSKALGLPMVSRRGRSVSEAIGLPAIARNGRSLSEVIGLRRNDRHFQDHPQRPPDVRGARPAHSIEAQRRGFRGTGDSDPHQETPHRHRGARHPDTRQVPVPVTLTTRPGIAPSWDRPQLG